MQDPTNRPDYTTNTPLINSYGQAAVAAYEAKFNYNETKPTLDFLANAESEYIDPYNTDYRDKTQESVLISIPGKSRQFISGLNLCIDCQPVIVDTNTPCTGTIAVVGNAHAVGGNTDPLHVIQRPFTPYGMFRECHIEMNGNRLDFNNGNSETFSFTQFMQIVLNANKKDKERLRDSIDFDMPDSATFDPDEPVVATLNTVYNNGNAYHRRRRAKMLKRQDPTDPATAGRQNYILPLNIPVLKSTVMPVVGVNLNVKLTKADPRVLFQCNAGHNNAVCDMKIHEIRLQVKRLSLNVNFFKAVMDNVMKSKVFKFNVVHTKCSRFNMSEGATFFSNHFVQTGTKPDMMFVSFLNDQALTGNNEHSPFKLINLHPTKASLTFDSNTYPPKHGYEWRDNITEMNKKLIYSQMTNSVWGTEYDHTPDAKFWDKDRYDNFLHTLVFDMTDSQTGYLSNIIDHPNQSGPVGAELTFANGVPRQTMVLFTSLYSTSIDLNADTLTASMNMV